MKNNLIFDKLDQTIRRLNAGMVVEFGEVRIVWELAYSTIQDYFNQKEKNKLVVDEESLEMLAKLNELITAFFVRFPKRTETPYVSPLTIPSWPPNDNRHISDDLNQGPRLMPRKDGMGWEWNTGTNLPPTTHTYSTSTGE